MVHHGGMSSGGGLHGLFLVNESGVKKWLGHLNIHKTRIGILLIAMVTYLGVIIAYVFFKAHTFSDAFVFLGKMISLDQLSILSTGECQTSFIVTLLVCGFHLYMHNRSFEKMIFKIPIAARAVMIAVMMIFLILTPGDDRAFIYFQF